MWTTHAHPTITARLKLAWVLFLIGSGSFANASAAEILTKASEVRALSITRAEQGLEARLRGVILFLEPGSIFIQDDTSSTFFQAESFGALGNLRVGDEVEVEGRTRMGLFQPGLGPSRFRVIGHSPLPPGIPVSYDDLLSGRYHYRRVTIEGVLRTVDLQDEAQTRLRVALGPRSVEVRIGTLPDRGRSLVDARVRISGLAAGLINERRQLVQPYLWLADWSDLEIVRAAPVPSEIPLISATELLAFKDNSVSEHRVRVEGTVSAVFPAGVVYLRQDAVAFGVRFRTTPPLQEGDRLTVLGFPEMDRYSATVTDAVILQRESGPPIAPLILEAPDDLSGAHDGNLITVTGTVRAAFKHEGGATLSLKGRTRTIEVHLPEIATELEPLSQVQVTGICVVQSARGGSNLFTSSADTLALRARTSADVQVLNNPPWWTPRRLTVLLTALGALTLLIALWNRALHRQVQRQTHALRRRIESEAALEERQRIAREFHDSLQQDLTGLGLRLDAAATRPLDEKAQRIIEISRSLLSRIQAETRNFVSDLRDATENDGDLTKALETIAGLPYPEGIQVKIEWLAAPPTLSAGTLHHLRMMVRESVSNAVKHAQASTITIKVDSDKSMLAVTIIDNGCGFDPVAKTQGTSGHFGCVGIRERAHKIGAEVNWESMPQKGTSVEIKVPRVSSSPRIESELSLSRP